jgi:Rrf2 family protein
MLEITRQADYALRAALEVARLTPGERIPTAEIAERQEIPLPFLSKIIGQLAVHRIVKATRGVGGGVSLARSADTISLREIIEAIDGPITLNACTRDPEVCGRTETCPLCPVFRDAREMLLFYFGTVTLGSLVEESEPITA